MIDRSTASVLQQMEHWGYYLLPQTHADSPGYTGLLVALRAHPTLKHFDPELLCIPLVQSDGRFDDTQMTLEHPGRSTRVAVGTVVLTDRKQKQERFFTFGGTLESTAVPGETVYSLRSSAPILWLSPQGKFGADQLSGEVGRLLAEIRAGYMENESEYYRRLGGMEPLALYIACLYTLFAEYEKEPGLRESFADFHMLLHAEKRWLEQVGLWASEPVRIQDLFTAAGQFEFR